MPPPPARASSGCAWSRPPRAASAIVKPQVSFFERYGSAGFAALEDVIAAARAAGLLVIADAKRGDIGSTMDAYARGVAHARVAARGGRHDGEPVPRRRDARRARSRSPRRHGKGVFVLAATSNPEAFAAQRADRSTTGATVSAGIVAEVVAAQRPHHAGRASGRASAS